MAFELPELNYPLNGLEPYISAETINYHYMKHHQTYVNNLNNLIAETQYETASLEQIIKNTQGALYNNAGQVWNHNFYWNCLTPKGGGEPYGELSSAIDKQFGSFAAFKDEFSKMAITKFGSGWAWLVKNKAGDLAITSTSNGDTPLTSDAKALLTCDVWEHAYYIDYRNARPKYVEAFWNLINWNFVEKQFHA